MMRAKLVGLAGFAQLFDERKMVKEGRIAGVG